MYLLKLNGGNAFLEDYNCQAAVKQKRIETVLCSQVTIVNGGHGNSIQTNVVQNLQFKQDQKARPQARMDRMKKMKNF